MLRDHSGSVDLRLSPDSDSKLSTEPLLKRVLSTTYIRHPRRLNDLMESYAVGYAVEGSSITSFDKERFHHLWWSLLGISPCLLKAGPHDVGLAVSAVQRLNQHLWHVWTLSSAPKITSYLQRHLTLNFYMWPNSSSTDKQQLHKQFGLSHGEYLFGRLRSLFLQSGWMTIPQLYLYVCW